jgi:hypothetical protein
LGQSPRTKRENFGILGLGQESDSMKLIVKGIAILVVLGMIGLVGFAYLGDLSPNQTVITKPVVLDGQ